MRRLTFSLTLLVLAAIPLLAGNYDPADWNTGDFHGCAPQGKSDDPNRPADSDLNLRKNRDKAPENYQYFSVKQVLANKTPKVLAALAQAQHEHKRLLRHEWTSEMQEEVADWEAQGAKVGGYLQLTRREGKESCNCGSTAFADYHMWLTAEKLPNDDRVRAVVVETSPRTQSLHASWTNKRLASLYKGHPRVRMSGWLMFDQEHPEQLKKTRGTLWEVHPIHKIEILKGNHWVEL